MMRHSGQTARMRGVQRSLHNGTQSVTQQHSYYQRLQSNNYVQTFKLFCQGTWRELISARDESFTMNFLIEHSIQVSIEHRYLQHLMNSYTRHTFAT